ncbi:TPA: hypothetical protein N0F65_002323 [Lagenidium giganteum]|uniref:Fibronectin type-III domain-containing protein n=1 Tax=Lagenidium giganteum TaxID=4803 RepID=A0AAV2Z785_9STRA|nr:TPA: hypothetical protein N0F65_002323 [Lagenidium giganteum]
MKAEADADQILAEQFERDLNALIQQSREKRSAIDGGNTDAASSSDSSNDAATESTKFALEVAYYGTVGQKLAQTVYELLYETQELATRKKLVLLLSTADRFAALQEYTAAASLLYKPLISFLTQAGSDASTGLADWESVLLVRAQHGLATARFTTAMKADRLVRHPGTLETMLSALALVQQSMERTLMLEHKAPQQYAWLVANGTFLIFTIAKPLQLLGYEADVVAYFKWCLLSLESVVTLCTTKFIIWRLQLYTSICDCYEAMAHKTTLPAQRARHTKAALACADHALKTVLRLKKEEELDLPMPQEVLATLTKAQMITAMLVARIKALHNNEAVTIAVVDSTVADPFYRIRFAVEVVEKLTMADRACIGYLSAPVAGTTEVTDMLKYLYDLVLPLLAPLLPQQTLLGSSRGGPSVDSDPKVRQATFPVTMHWMVLRHYYRTRKRAELGFFLQTARVRLSTDAWKSASESEAVAHELCIYEALAALLAAEDELGEHETTDPAPTATQGTDTARVSTPAKKTVRDHTWIELNTTKRVLPVSQLRALVRAVHEAIAERNSTVVLTNRDLMTATALLLWRQYGRVLVDELDATEQAQFKPEVLRLTADILLTVHATFMSAHFDDMLLHGVVCVRLAMALRQINQRRRGIEALRSMTERIDARRDHLANGALHFERSRVEQGDALAGATFTFHLDRKLAQSDCATPGAPTTRDGVGVIGSGSQYGGMHQELCCLQVDILAALYQSELEEAALSDHLLQKLSAAAAEAAASSSAAMGRACAPGRVQAALTTACRKNGYLKALLSLQRLKAAFNMTTKELNAMADECMQELQRTDKHEHKLMKQLMVERQRAATNATPVPTAVPRAPLIIARCSTSITVEIVPFHSSLPPSKRKKVAYYAVYGKSSGAGTDVSLTNTLLPGTGQPVYPPDLRVTITGLVPNDSYVFAVAAFDARGDVIQGIGETSDLVVACNPLPLILCYAYLAQLCHELDLPVPAKRAATAFYERIVSRLDATARRRWKANPFYRHALQRDEIARLPVPVLTAGVQTMLILCRDEPGDPERDGRITDVMSPLVPVQVGSLELAKKVTMGIELASAAGNLEAIRLLCFKGYRLLLPVLHLDSCRSMMYEALMVLFQALLQIPMTQWDIDTKSIASRIGFELFRLAKENRHIAPATLQALAHVRADEVVAQLCSDDGHGSGVSNEFAALQEALLLREVTDGTKAPPPSLSRPSTGVPASTSKPPPTAKNASTPQPTPRLPGAPGETVPTLDELLKQAQFHVADTVKMLDAFAHDPRSVAYLCKLAVVALERGDDAQVEQWLSAVRLHRIKTTAPFREFIASVGGDELFVVDNVAVGDGKGDGKVDGKGDKSVPNTARSTTAASKTPRAAHGEEGDAGAEGMDDANALDSAASPRSEAEENDQDLCLWCGELFLLQALMLYRKMVKKRLITPVHDPTLGPTEDCTFEFLYGRPEATSNTRDHLLLTEADTDATTARPEGQDPAPASAREEAEEDQMREWFSTFLRKISASAALFEQCGAWQGLQVACQYLWNALWIAWVSPRAVAANSVWNTQVVDTVRNLLEMLDVVTAPEDHTQNHEATISATALFARTGRGISATQGGSCGIVLASTTVMSSIGSTLGTDLTWISNLVGYTLQVLTAAQDWKEVVAIGKHYHTLCGATAGSTSGSAATTTSTRRFSEMHFPILIYAQTQRLDEQKTVVRGLQEALAQFVRAFEEKEAKKKKKKSRLVVEEVLTQEEIDFRDAKAVQEQQIGDAVNERQIRETELKELVQTHDSLVKAINKSVQSLDICHELLEKYRRTNSRSHATAGGSGGGGDAHGSVVAAAAQPIVLRSQIVSAYMAAVASARQKRQTRLICLAFHELGDFHLACGELRLALKSWNDGIDNAFGELNAAKSWRDVVPDLKGKTLAEHIAGDGLWITLHTCILLSKLMLHASGSDSFHLLEYAAMASTLFLRLLDCSLPHPTKAFRFGYYQLPAEFWPGRDLVLDRERLPLFSLGVACAIAPQVLLEYEQSVLSMPLIAGYQYIATYCFEDPNQVANALRLRVDALVLSGRFEQACEMLARIFLGVGVPSTRERAVNRAAGSQTPPLPAFCDGKPLRDAANVPVVGWLTATLDVAKLFADLSLLYKSELAELIVCSTLRLARTLAHVERLTEASPLRLAVIKACAAFITIVQKQLAIALEDNKGNALTTAARQVRATKLLGEVMLLQSDALFDDGQWKQAREMAVKALALAKQGAIRPWTSRGGGSADPGSVMEVDREAPLTWFHRLSAVALKSRLQLLRCDMVAGMFKQVLSQSDTAMEEGRESEEVHLGQRVELLRIQALVLLGERRRAEAALVQLREACVKHHNHVSRDFVTLLQMLGVLVRARGMLGKPAKPSKAAPDTASLQMCTQTATQILEETTHIVDQLLELEGWIGTTVDPATDKRMNLYRPLLPSFVQTKFLLAQVLVEEPPQSAEDVLPRLLSVLNDGLRGLAHTVRPLPALKAGLLLLKGAALRKAMVHAQAQASIAASNTEKSNDGDTSRGTVLVPQAATQPTTEAFDVCVDTLISCINESINNGGYDRVVVRLALIELVDLYGQKLLPDSVMPHMHAALHYLKLAFAVQQQTNVVFDSLELQTQPVTALEKLTPCILSSVPSLSPATIAALEQRSGKADAPAPPPVAIPAPAGKKGSSAAINTAQVAQPIPVDGATAAAIVNYFIRLSREKDVLPTMCELQREMAAQLHQYLVQCHPSYAKTCCLTELPPVPSEDPDVRPGLVLAQWSRDITPAIAVASFMSSTAETALPATGNTTPGQMTLYFALGTAKIEVKEDAVPLENQERFHARTQRFQGAPVLNKRPSVPESEVRKLRQQLGALRVEMEDDQSLVINRATFADRLQVILLDIQTFFRPIEATATASDVDKPHVPMNRSSSTLASSLVDAFGNLQKVPCTLEMVVQLENLFSVSKGLSAADNALCYFLRDLLDN